MSTAPHGWLILLLVFRTQYHVLFYEIRRFDCAARAHVCVCGGGTGASTVTGSERLQYMQLSSVLRRQRRNKSGHGHGHGHSHGHSSTCALNASPEDADLFAIANTDEPLDFEIELVDVAFPGSYAKENWELTPAEKLGRAVQLKEAGNELYKAGDSNSALEKYRTALDCLEVILIAGPLHSDDLAAGPGSNIQTAEIERAAVLLNCAAAELKLGRFPAAVESTSQVIAKDPSCAKAYYRRGQAHLRRGRDVELALEDLRVASELAPSNAAITRAVAEAKAAIDAAKTDDAKRYRGMFGGTN